MSSKEAPGIGANDLLKNGIECLVDLGRAGQEVKTIEIHGQTYTAQKANLVSPPRAKTIQVRSLQGLADYVALNPDNLAETFALIENPVNVTLCGPIDPVHRDREAHVIAVSYLDGLPRIGQTMDQEAASVWLQAHFDETEGDDLAYVKLMIGSVSSGNTRKDEDNGVAQVVNVSLGVTKLGVESVKSPVSLTARRVFPGEIKLKPSPFVIRISPGENNKPMFTFHEADSNAWKVEALGAIREWLQKACPKLAVIG